MDVKVAEENAVVGVGNALHLDPLARSHAIGRERNRCDLAVELWFRPPVDKPERGQQEPKADHGTKTTFFPRTHALDSIGRRGPVSKQFGASLPVLWASVGLC